MQCYVDKSHFNLFVRYQYHCLALLTSLIFYPILSYSCHPRTVIQENYGDVPRKVSLLVPSGWNKFEGEVGAYDLKWQDLVDNKENIKISSTPVKSTTTSM